MATVGARFLCYARGVCVVMCGDVLALPEVMMGMSGCWLFLHVLFCMFVCVFHKWELLVNAFTPMIIACGCLYTNDHSACGCLYTNEHSA